MITKESLIEAASGQFYMNRANAQNLVESIWPETDLLAQIGESISNRKWNQALPEVKQIKRQKHADWRTIT